MGVRNGIMDAALILFRGAVALNVHSPGESCCKNGKGAAGVKWVACTVCAPYHADKAPHNAVNAMCVCASVHAVRLILLHHTQVTGSDLGAIKEARVRLAEKGLGAAWHLKQVRVRSLDVCGCRSIGLPVLCTEAAVPSCPVGASVIL